MSGDEFLDLIDALNDARAVLDDDSEARFILDGLLFNVLDDAMRGDGDERYSVIDFEDASLDELRGIVFDNPQDAADYLDDIPVGGEIVDLGDGYFGVTVSSTSDGAEIA